MSALHHKQIVGNTADYINCCWIRGSGMLPSEMLETVIHALAEGAILCRRRNDGTLGLALQREELTQSSCERELFTCAQFIHLRLGQLEKEAELFPPRNANIRILTCPSFWCRHKKHDVLTLVSSIVEYIRPESASTADSLLLLGCRHPFCIRIQPTAQLLVVAGIDGWLLQFSGGKRRFDSHRKVPDPAQHIANAWEALKSL